MSAIEKDRMLQFRGEDLSDRDGEKIGRIEEIYLDADSGEPEWALVHTGLFGSKRNFVPLADATEVDGKLRVPLEKDTVKDAPGIEPNGQLTKAEEAKLYAHYGLEYSESE
jgi:sporulation protein YlmC with PRC-barrel domain